MWLFWISFLDNSWLFKEIFRPVQFQDEKFASQTWYTHFLRRTYKFDKASLRRKIFLTFSKAFFASSFLFSFPQIFIFQRKEKEKTLMLLLFFQTYRLLTQDIDDTSTDCTKLPTNIFSKKPLTAAEAWNVPGNTLSYSACETIKFVFN